MMVLYLRHMLHTGRRDRHFKAVCSGEVGVNFDRVINGKAAAVFANRIDQMRGMRGNGHRTEDHPSHADQSIAYVKIKAGRPANEKTR